MSADFSSSISIKFAVPKKSSNVNISKANLSDNITTKIEPISSVSSINIESIKFSGSSNQESKFEKGLKTVAATSLDIGASFVSGFVSTAIEDMIDGTALVTGTILVGAGSVFNVFASEEYKIDVDKIEENLNNFVMTDYTGDFFDELTSSDFIDNYSTASDSVLQVASLAGDIAGATALNLTSGALGMATSMLAGYSNGYQKAVKNGASFTEATANGALNATITGLTKDTLKVIGNDAKVAASLSAHTGVTEGLAKYVVGGAVTGAVGAELKNVSSYITYGNNISSNYAEYFQSSGGASSIMTGAVSGALTTGIKMSNSYNSVVNSESRISDTTTATAKALVKNSSNITKSTHNITNDLFSSNNSENSFSTIEFSHNNGSIIHDSLDDLSSTLKTNN